MGSFFPTYFCILTILHRPRGGNRFHRYNNTMSPAPIYATQFNGKELYDTQNMLELWMRGIWSRMKYSSLNLNIACEGFSSWIYPSSFAPNPNHRYYRYTRSLWPRIPECYRMLLQIILVQVFSEFPTSSSVPTPMSPYINLQPRSPRHMDRQGRKDIWRFGGVLPRPFIRRGVAFTEKRRRITNVPRAFVPRIQRENAGPPNGRFQLRSSSSTSQRCSTRSRACSEARMGQTGAWKQKRWWVPTHSSRMYCKDPSIPPRADANSETSFSCPLAIRGCCPNDGQTEFIEGNRNNSCLCLELVTEVYAQGRTRDNHISLKGSITGERCCRYIRTITKDTRTFQRGESYRQYWYLYSHLFT